MSHRRRGALFAAVSCVAALIAASAVSRHEAGVAAQAPLRPAVVAAVAIEAGSRLEPGDLEIRKFPVSFLAPGALADPIAALGQKAAIGIPAGAYVLPSMLSTGDDPTPPQRRPVGTPVEIAVAGGGALRPLVGTRVDVLVTRDSRTGLGGETRVAVANVRLLGLARRGAGTVATLVVKRAEAIRLVQAGSYARELRLIASVR